MKLSCVTSVFVNYSLADTITQIAGAGYQGIDVWAGRPHAYRRDHSPAQLARLRQQIEANHLTVPSVLPAFFRYPHSLSSPNQIIRQDSIDYVRQCADSAAALGAPVVLIVPTQALNGQSHEDARQRLLDSVHTLAAYVQQYKLKLGVEPANRMVTNLVNTAGDALALIADLGTSNVGVVLDSGHINLSGESAQDEITKLGPALLQIHLNDNNGHHQQNAIPGEGTFDFAALLNFLAQSGYDGFLSLELGWEYTTAPAPAIREAAKRLRALAQHPS
jgi:fructoselysine 3-epimerase